MADGGKVIIKIDGDSKEFQSAMDKTKDIAGKAAKGIAVGVGAAATAIGAIGTQAVKVYADYEQLVGGVETLFKQNADVVQNYANQAYQTAGMSANQYMETVTGFSASLLQSLGGDTAKAAEYGNQAVIDMSDNANKMGTSIEMIQNAYQGFAKQNYTMLDNLKLGYGGTKEEMERLVNDAAKLDSSIQANDLSFSNIVKSIHAVQTQMGITGTTAEEAATTIQGSLGMVKASWENLLTGLADPNADIDLLIDNVINSVMTLGQNLEPVIQAVLDKIPIMLDTLGGVIIQKIPEVVNTILPELVNSASNLISTLANSLNANAATLSDTAVSILMALVNAIIDNIPILISVAGTIILNLVQGLSEALPDLIPAAVDMILQIVDGLLDNLDKIIDAALNLILALAEGLINALPKLIEKIPQIVIKLSDAFVENAPKLVTAALQLIITLGKGLIQAIPTLIKNIPTIIIAIVKAFTAGAASIVSVGKNIVTGIWNGIISAKDWLLNKIKSFAHTITQGIKDFFGIHSPSTVMRDEVGKMIALGLAAGIEDNRSEVEKVMDEMNKKLLDSEQKYIDESERLKDSKSEADKKYLDELKETSEKERKIYDAMTKDIEANKKSIVQIYTDIAEAAFDSIEEVQKAQESMAKKLSSYGDLYKTTTITSGDGKLQTKSLSDLSEQTKVLTEYGNMLEAVKNRGAVPQEFFSVMRDMTVEEGLEFAQSLMDLSDDEFKKYINNWETKQEAAERISRALYVDEAKEAKEEFENAFKTANTDIEQQGKENAQAWGEGFLKQLSELVPQIKLSITEAFDSLFAVDGSLSFAGNNGNSYTTTYYVMPSSGESTAAQIKALNDANTLNKMRGGY